MAIKYRPLKSSEEFWNEINNIKLERIKIGLDKEMLSSSRITKAITKQPEWDTLKKRLIRFPRDKTLDKRGITYQIMIVLGIAIFFIILMVGYFVWSLAAPIASGIFGTTTNTFLTATHNETPNNLSNVATPFITNGQNTVANLKWLGYGMLIAGIICFMIFAYSIRTYPFFLFIWIFFVLMFAAIGMYVSNIYQSVPLTPLTSGWTMDSFIMTNLPAIIVSGGIFLGILLFIIPTRDPAMEEGSI